MERDPEFEKQLDITSSTLTKARRMIDNGIQKLLNEMMEKRADDGTLTFKITFATEDTETLDHMAKRLHFAYKVNTQISIKDEEKDEQMNNEDELQYVDGRWILMPITGRPQRTLLD